MSNFLLRSILITLLSVILLSTSYSQTLEEKERIAGQTNVLELKAMAEKSRADYQANKALALQLAKEKGWVIRKEFDGGFYELQGVTEDGKPLYYTTFNADAAESVSTDEVYSGGSAGLSLDGTGMVAGEWDAGDVLTTHQEFNNTGSSRVIDQDGSGSTHYHSTHVGGTIIGGGVEAQAKGMAYNATLDAYDWNSDFSEMAMAASNGLLISNHSYGTIAGWYWNGSDWVWYGDTGISNDEDYHFGFYGSQCEDLDEMAHNAPYYLICFAAGNDRGDGAGETGHPPDGGTDGYDCIGYKGNAKNILTVGAVKDVPGGYSGDPTDVEMTSFSSWGPSDDGRIKPDIVGNGYYLYSAYDGANDDYNSISGTSMATPNVVGSLLLLQEHFNESYGNYMKSATLKALAIHTADECGPNNGPDYMYGWGILNTESAAQVISDRDVSTFIKEESLDDGDTYTFDVSATGTEPLVVTLVWTDLPGTPVSPQLDPTDPMLVNDLDMTVADVTAETTFYPYMLDGQNPSNAATTGDNDVDNVEKIVIDAPATGTYTIEIDHEGSISQGTQNFSLIVSGISNGYPVVTTGAATGITLTSADVSGEVIADNGNTVTERGFVYNLTGNPSTADNKVQVGSGLGTFSTTLSGLTPGTDYYVRAYAINSEGTAYGNEQQFNTLCGVIATLPFEEDFSQQTLPTCWQNIDNQGGGQIWQFVPGTYEFSGGETFNATTASNGFAALDSDNYGSGNSQDADLISPEFDLSGYTSVYLSFEHYYKDYQSEQASVYYSTNGGASWNIIQSWSGSTTNNPEVFSQDISNEVAGESGVMLKWNYTGTWGFHWAVDDIAITGSTGCSPPSTQASGFTVDNSDVDNVTISWTRGDGDSVLVIAKSGAPVDADPVNGVFYSDDAAFGNGDELGTGNFVVYSGTGTSVNVSALSSGTTYHFAVYEFNDPACYLTPGLAGMATTNTMDYTVTFNVTDSGTGDPISGAEIDIDGNNLTTDGTGEATIDLPDGTYSYTVTTTGYQNANGSVTVSGADVTENVGLSPLEYTVTFNVTDANSTDPISGAEITIDGSNLTTDGSGQASIDLPDDTYSYTVTASGYQGESANITVSGADVTENVQLTPIEYTVTFNVTDDDTGDPISGAEIDIDGNNLTTDGTGEATIDLPDGTYSYSVTASGYQSTSGNVSVSGSDVTVNVGLEPELPDEYTVTFTVTDAITADPISGANVSIDGNNLTTNSSGEATIDLPDGTYSYTITAAGYQNSSGNVTVSGANVNVDVSLDPMEYTVTFIVTDESSGDPVSGASVEIDGNILTTDASGQAAIDLPNGTYSYTVTAPGYQTAAGSITVSGSSVTEDVVLQLMEYTVTFLVTDISTSDPIENAEIDIDGELLTTNASGEAFIDLVNGTYAYTVTAAGYETVDDDVLVDGDDVTEEVMMDFGTGVVSNPGSKSSVKIYPNPARGLFNIELEKVAPRMSVQIRSAKGVVVLEEEVFGTKFYEADLRNMANGTYLVEIMVDKKIYTKKVILK